MLAFIVFGTTSLTFNSSTGKFFCPTCGSSQAYQAKSIRRFFTIYFIPLIPLDRMGSFVECLACHGKFDDEVLTLDETALTQLNRKKFAEHCRRLMILTMIADGTVEEDELATIEDQVRALGGEPPSSARMDADVALAFEADIDSIGYVREIADGLSAEERELVVKCMFLVATAAGGLGEQQQQQLEQLPGVLGISDEQFRAVVNRALEE